jgi:hypothetical protein
MPQYNLFGEIEIQATPEPGVVPEMPELPPMPHRKSKKRKSFEIGICKACGQLLLDDPENTRIKIDEELCEDCDDRLKAKYSQYKNFALIRALRLRKTA